MRKVERLSKPNSLRNNAAQWTKELMDEIQEKGSYSKADDSVKHKYRQKDVKDTLEKMYQQHCCYCESMIGRSSYGRIEHLKPKSLPEFYQYAFEWENLHWCCEICNTSYKRDNWDFQDPILDPSKDDIDRFLKLDLTTGKYEAIGNDKRARTTILHTGLNREELVKARRQIIIRFLKDYRAHQKAGNGKRFCDEWKLLKEDYDYPSVYDSLIQTIVKENT
ncbi:MAG: TIGR02646 family protein [Firmicutes bacterium]|nr:TIGR02646 family protein [Bacillota bacterium]